MLFLKKVTHLLHKLESWLCDETPLHTAVRDGDIDEVSNLIDKNLNIDAESAIDETAACLAIRLQKHDCLRILLNNGANPNKTANYLAKLSDRGLIALVGMVLQTILTFFLGIFIYEGISLLHLPFLLCQAFLFCKVANILSSFNQVVRHSGKTTYINVAMECKHNTTLKIILEHCNKEYLDDSIITHLREVADNIKAPKEQVETDDPAFTENTSLIYRHTSNPSDVYFSGNQEVCLDMTSNRKRLSQ